MPGPTPRISFNWGGGSPGVVWGQALMFLKGSSGGQAARAESHWPAPWSRVLRLEALGPDSRGQGQAQEAEVPQHFEVGAH